MSILVTGAGGYIGSVLVPKLLEAGYHVLAVDQFFFGEDKLPVHERLTKLRTDVRTLSPKLFHGVEAVIDLVAISNDPSGEFFHNATNEINHISRVRNARLAKQAGASRYILPSSCSIYGFHKEDLVLDETSPINPLTTYAKANRKAEEDVLTLSDDEFTVVIMRQATVFGLSPRMRFDLAINGMTEGAWAKGVIPLMRDGSQWRPFVHVQDTTDVMLLLLQADPQIINGQIFNVGSEENNYRLQDLAQQVCDVLPRDVQIEWYGDPDHRSYKIGFEKIKNTLGWEARWNAGDGALEIYEALEQARVSKTLETITLEWYKHLTKAGNAI